MPCPRKSDGFIDYDEIFKIVVGTLNRPIEDLEKLTLKQVYLLNDNHIQNQRDHYEMMAHVVRVGYVSAHSKKEIKLFQNSKQRSNNTVTAETREQVLKELSDEFGN
ncbi:hypothetical protein QT711_03085 [Sporosarcina saromensis]|uniref:Uncharacterized protein n=1 Tax=Sporosarcina saromensis TaxID=359365 RepID=A0ABU4G5B9_9BACL|nr:hypothetical protein [Sporosarcina saromensis]MDW0112154.1 hypothetical protein [Sporosarcina saromensis]